LADRDSLPEHVAVFDLDGTITRVDTYVHFLFAVMRRYPLRVLRGAWLPLALVIHKSRLKDNSCWQQRNPDGYRH